ncbi:MAG: high frequency lysogenization protein HflD [Gammaproteobacteria bacterium]|nr:high frequency lysogenization protein HflD [Gammaproteobacteria bacterium]
MTDIENRCIALAGLVQACMQVRQLALKGTDDSQSLVTAIEAILKIDPVDTLDVFGSISRIQDGLKMIKSYQFDQEKHDIELTKMIMISLTLSKKLMARNDYLERIEHQITSIKEQIEFFNIEHANVTANIAGLYQETISNITPRIMVKGNMTHLDQKNNANKIRTYLLSAVRCGVLWHQVGGSRWHLLVKRNQYLKTAQSLLNDLYQ